MMKRENNNSSYFLLFIISIRLEGRIFTLACSMFRRGEEERKQFKKMRQQRIVWKERKVEGEELLK